MLTGSCSAVSPAGPFARPFSSREPPFSRPGARAVEPSSHRAAGDPPQGRPLPRPFRRGQHRAQGDRAFRMAPVPWPRRRPVRSPSSLLCAGLTSREGEDRVIEPKQLRERVGHLAPTAARRASCKGLSRLRPTTHRLEHDACDLPLNASPAAHSAHTCCRPCPDR